MRDPSDPEVQTEAQSRQTPPDAQAEQQVRLDPDKLAAFQRKMHAEQSLGAGAAAGLTGALVGAVLWAVITVATGYQIGFMAIGVGLIVGIAVRKAGRGIDSRFGLLGAALAFFGCVLGNVFTVVAVVSREYGVPMFSVLGDLGVGGSIEAVFDTSSFMDIIFYGIAVYEGYKFSFRRLTNKEVEQLVA